jgi:hypothetical protein
LSGFSTSFQTAVRQLLSAALPPKVRHIFLPHKWRGMEVRAFFLAFLIVAPKTKQKTRVNKRYAPLLLSGSYGLFNNQAIKNRP